MSWLPELPPSAWLLALACALCTGLAKAGVPGFGMIPILLMAEIFPARQSTGVLLLLLIIGDAAAVRAFHRHARWIQIRRLLPPAILGVMAGWFAMGRIDDALFRPVIGWIILVLTALHLSRPLLDRWMENTPHSPAFAWTMGGLGGVTTMLANAAGPVMTLFFLALRLPKMEMVATGAWFFFFINLTKVPVYTYHGLFSAQGLLFDSVLLLPTLTGAMVGRKLISRIPEKVFLTAVIVLAFLATILLFLPARR